MTVFFISAKLFSFEVFNSTTSEYFAVRSCTPITKKISRIKFEDCNGTSKSIDNGLCTNLNNRCKVSDAKVEKANSNVSKAAMYTKPQEKFEPAVQVESTRP